jgi:hypothetical protein
VTLKLSVTNETNINYASVTHFQSDDHGKVDLTEMLPKCNSYLNPDPMAIFWTMTPQANSDSRFWPLNVPNGLFCTYQVYKGHLQPEEITPNSEPLAIESTKKEYMGDAVQRIEIKVF